jgi:predicted HicB family RNase H-like nuclease
MVTPMKEKTIRKPRNIKIDPEALHRARVEALRSKKTVEQWLEEAIDEKIEREEKKVK